MNIIKLTAVLSLTAALAAAVPAMAFASDGAEDGSGVETLGVSITGVANDPASVHQFLSQLSPDARPAVIGGCETAIANPQDTTANVVSFCETATGGHGMAMNPAARAPSTVY